MSPRAHASRPARSAPRSARGSARAGRVPLVVPLALAIACAVWLAVSLASDVRASGFARIDPRQARLDVETGFVDPRWNQMLAAELARYRPVSPTDEAGVRALARAVGALPFVAAVGQPEVLWPDGVDVPLRLRTPAACVAQGFEFAVVSEDGVLLPGRWPTPPWVDTGGGHVGFLPVIGPSDGALDGLPPGARLGEARHQDALEVAISMRAALRKEDFEVLGPPLIDATRARLAAVDEPGVVIRLEERRVLWFGRLPSARAPGERPVSHKWLDRRRAAASLHGLGRAPRPEGARDWSFLDLRWDAPDITYRDPPSAAEPDEPVATRPRAPTQR